MTVTVRLGADAYKRTICHFCQRDNKEQKMTKRQQRTKNDCSVLSGVGSIASAQSQPALKE